MGNILSCNVGSYGRYRDTAYAHLQKIGVRHVEVKAPKPEEADFVKESLNYFGLSATTLMASGDIRNETVAEAFVPAFQAAQKMGVKVIFTSIHAGEVPLSTVYERLRRIGDVAAAHGVTVAMETHPDLCENGTVGLRTMEAVGHPNIRLNFDTANVYYYNQGINGVEELGKVAQYVAAVHLKDTNGGYKTWYFPTLGEGVVDFKETFRILNKLGMHGPFTMELEGIQGENLNLQGQHDRVAESVAYLRGLGVFD